MLCGLYFVYFAIEDFFALGSSTRKKPEPRKKPDQKKIRPKKLTDLEINIQFLEQKGTLVPIEHKMLANYKERQAFLAGENYENSEAVEENGHGNDDTNKPTSDQDTPVKPTSSSKQVKKKQAFPSSFVLFKREQVIQFKKETPEKKIGRDFCVDLWKNMTTDEKKIYQEKAALEKDKLGEEFRKNIKSNSMSEAEKKESKRQSNLQHRNIMKEEKVKREIRENNCKQRFSEIIHMREEKLKILKRKGAQLSSGLSEIEVEDSVIMKILEDKESQNTSLKEKYAVLYKTHKSCIKKSC